jgi:hypothetical protein
MEFLLELELPANKNSGARRHVAAFEGADVSAHSKSRRLPQGDS